MRAKVRRDDAGGDVRGVLAELGELVGDLGLGDPTASTPLRAGAPVEPGEADQASAAAEPTVPELGAETPSAAEEVVFAGAGPESSQASAVAEQTIPELGAETPSAAEQPALTAAEPELTAEQPGLTADVLKRSSFSEADAAELARLVAAATGDGSAQIIPLWESAADDDSPKPTTLWDAFSPELDAAPPRAWTPAAASEVLEPASPPGAPTEPPDRHRLADAFRSRLFTATTIAAVVVAIAVVILTRIDFGSTTGPAHPVSKAAFEVTTMRTVDATSAATVALAPTHSHFAPKATQVFMDVAYRNAAKGETIRLVISLLPPAGSGGTPVKVGDQTHQLPAGGEIAVTIQGPSTGFSPGDYTVTAFHDGHLEQSLTFTIDATTPASPTAAAPPTP
jgi:hypothetical protein